MHLDTMEQDQESFLPRAERDCSRTYDNNITRLRKKLLFSIVSLFLIVCLAIYLYLNLVASDTNQPDPNSFKPLSRRRPMLDHESIFSDSGPSMIRLDDLIANCIVALHIGGREVVERSLLKNDQLDQVGSKGKTQEGLDDIVTGADLKSHELIVNTIKDSYRRLKVVSEEDTTKAFEGLRLEDDILPINRREFANMLRNSLEEIEPEYRDAGNLIVQHETLVWIDPLDATKEYSENLTEYVTLMACIVYRSEPIVGIVYKPFENRTFWSIRDNSGQIRLSPDLAKLFNSKQTHNSDDSINFVVSRSHAGNVESNLREAFGGRAKMTVAGGSGFKTMQLVGGSVDAYVHVTRIKKWDICAPNAILRSLPGGNMTDLNGNSIDYGNAKKTVVETGLIATLNSNIHQDLVKYLKKLSPK